jgi:hypothetical protein
MSNFVVKELQGNQINLWYQGIQHSLGQVWGQNFAFEITYNYDLNGIFKGFIRIWGTQKGGNSFNLGLTLANMIEFKKGIEHVLKGKDIGWGQNPKFLSLGFGKSQNGTKMLSLSAGPDNKSQDRYRFYISGKEGNMEYKVSISQADMIAMYSQIKDIADGTMWTANIDHFKTMALARLNPNCCTYGQQLFIACQAQPSAKPSYNSNNDNNTKSNNFGSGSNNSNIEQFNSPSKPTNTQSQPVVNNAVTVSDDDDIV